MHDSFVAGSVQQTNIPDFVSTRDILKRIIVISLPLSFAQMAQFSISVFMFSVVGKLGVNELGGASIAYGLINATAFAFASGFCGALETVLSHTYGRDKKSKLYGIYTQRMFLMLMLIGLLLTPAILYMDRLLLRLGQDPVVVSFTGQFCRISVWGVFPAMLLELLRRYFACQHLNNPLSVNLIVSAAVFPLVLITLVHFFGFVGAPVSWCILMTFMSGGLLLYLHVTKLHKNTWGGWDDAAYRQWWPLLKLALPSMGMMFSEWIALDINNICSGFGTPEELAAFGITCEVSGLAWSFASGTFIAASVLVGNAIGREKPLLARRIAFCCLAVTIVIAIFNLTVTTLTKNHFPYFFTNDEKVVKIVHSLLNYFMVYHTFDIFQSCMMGILRGCGLQKIGAIVIAVVYSIVGVPLGVFLFLKTNFGVEALWFGPAVGVTCIGFPCYMYLLLHRIPWASLRPHEDGQELDVIEMEKDTHGDVILTMHSSSSHETRSSGSDGINEEGAGSHDHHHHHQHQHHSHATHHIKDDADEVFAGRLHDERRELSKTLTREDAWARQDGDIVVNGK